VNLDRDVGVILLVSLRMLSLLNVEELGERFVVLVAIGEGLCCDDVVY
jgi:hypothetical protein